MPLDIRVIIYGEYRNFYSVKLGHIFTSQRFGITTTLAISASIWLATTAVVHCSDVGAELKCRSDFLVIFLIEHNVWPFDNVPFTGYWDTNDNKLASIIAEPYSRLAITGAMIYLIWFRAMIYARKRYSREYVARINNNK